MSTKGQHHIDRLECRTLFSGWTTAEDFNPPAGAAAEYYDVAADGGGNVYAVGDRYDSGPMHGIVREKPAGGSTWTTLLDYSAMSFSGMGISFNAVAVSPKGDVYVGGSAETGSGWVVLEQPAGQSGFSVVDQVSGSVTPGTNTDLAIDAAGNVFAVGQVPVQVTVKTGGKTTTQTQWRWTVRERAAGAASFSTVDQFVYSTNPGADNYPYAVTATSSGIYVVGDVDSGGGAPVEHWIVRKSADGGATWKTVNDYQADPAATSRAEGVTVDAAGNLYVAGETSQRYVISTSRKGTTYGYNCQWVVRKSTDGGATWPLSLQTSFPIPTFSSEVVGFGMGTDAAGNVYAVHPQYDATGVEHSIVRSSAAGWQPVDDYQLAPGQNSGGFGFAAGPDGTLYACGYGIDAAGGHGIVRSTAGPAPASSTQTAALSPTFSSTSTSGTSQTTSQSTDTRLVDQLFPV